MRHWTSWTSAVLLLASNLYSEGFKQAIFFIDDIAPITEVAKAFTVLEAVVGRLYLVVAVDW